jgi:hypothetical protein
MKATFLVVVVVVRFFVLVFFFFGLQSNAGDLFGNSCRGGA